MKAERDYSVSKVLQDWENKVGPDHKLSLSEAERLADEIDREFCECESLVRILESLRNETSSPHISHEIKRAFYAILISIGFILLCFFVFWLTTG